MHILLMLYLDISKTSDQHLTIDLLEYDIEIANYVKEDRLTLSEFCNKSVFLFAILKINLHTQKYTFYVSYFSNQNHVSHTHRSKKFFFFGKYKYYTSICTIVLV